MDHVGTSAKHEVARPGAPRAVTCDRQQPDPSRRGAGTETGAGGSGGVADHRPEYWRMADALRGSMDAAEYKHVVHHLDLPPVRLRRLRPRQRLDVLEAESGRRARTPKDPDRVPRRRHLRGLYRRLRRAGRSCKARPKSARHLPAGGRRDDRHRARQPGARRRATEGLREGEVLVHRPASRRSSAA